MNQAGYGGGGGGFMRNVLGGIGGAMAGSWLYDKFLNSSAHANTHSNTSHESMPVDTNHTIDTNPDQLGDVAGDFSHQSDWDNSDMDSGIDMGGDDW